MPTERQVLEFLDLPVDSVRDYLYVSIPADKVDDTLVDEWARKNLARGVTAIQNSGRLIYAVNQVALAQMDNTYFDYIIDQANGTLAGKVCVGVEVNTAILDADVPVGYSPNGQIYDSEGEVERQKTVEELMICVRGTEGKSLILCSEKTNNGNGTGLQHEELLRFRGQFTSYYVATDAQIATWKANNIIIEE